MPNEVSKTIIKSGLVEPDTLQEFRRWGAPIPFVPTEETIEPNQIPSAIEEAMQKEDFIKVKETDLEVLQQYLRTQRRGVLHFHALADQEEKFEVSFGLTSLSEVILPWTDDEDISDFMVNGRTYLETDGKKIHFKDVRQLYYGDRRAFMICVPEGA